MEREPTWGVTVLEAAEQMDAGPIWSTATFPMRGASKRSVYREEISDAALRCVFDAIAKAQDPAFKPEPLDYSRPDVRGCWRDPMRQRDRVIDWQIDDTATVLRKIRAADGVPGVRDTMMGRDVYLYGACQEGHLRGEPGAVLATRNGAICRSTRDGAVWISHLRERADRCHETFKLPATTVLGADLDGIPEIPCHGLPSRGAATFKDIWYEEEADIGYLYFEFYNGAMSTEQCRRLQAAYRSVLRRRIKAVVLMGGRTFWSNGIHLNTIEAARDPGQESWDNINALNDLIHDIITTESHVTVAALHGSAGAGGVPLALAADVTYVRDGVSLNPNYRAMGGLFGSEYWTYLLPRRIGTEAAHNLVEACRPVADHQAASMGLVDGVIHHAPENTFHRQIGFAVGDLIAGDDWRERLAAKRDRRRREEAGKPLAQYRAEELERVKESFFTPNSAYHAARSAFVRKVPPSTTPWYLLVSETDSTRVDAA